MFALSCSLGKHPKIKSWSWILLAVVKFKVNHLIAVNKKAHLADGLIMNEHSRNN